jgi:hypothetical protein
MTSDAGEQPSGSTAPPDEVLDIWFDEETGVVTVHLDGIPDKNQCKASLLEFLAEAGITNIAKIEFTRVTRPGGGGGGRTRRRDRQGQRGKANN